MRRDPRGGGFAPIRHPVRHDRDHEGDVPSRERINLKCSQERTEIAKESGLKGLSLSSGRSFVGKTQL